MNSISHLVIVRCATFDTQDQILLGPQINALGNHGSGATRIDRKLQEWTQARKRKYIEVTVQVPAFNGNQQITSCACECVKVIRESRVAQISRWDSAPNFIRANR